MSDQDATGNGDRISVVIVDDHAIVRQGLRTYLETQPDIEVMAEAANGQEALEVTRETLPDIVLMDLVMPVMDGVEATRAVTAASPSTRVQGGRSVRRGSSTPHEEGAVASLTCIAASVSPSRSPAGPLREARLPVSRRASRSSRSRGGSRTASSVAGRP